MSSATAPYPFDSNARRALIVVCVTLGLSTVAFRVAVGYLNVHLQKKRVDTREHFNTINNLVGEWEAIRQGEPLSKEMIEELGTSVYLNRDYGWHGESEPQLSLHLAYYTGGIDAVPHVPDRCLVAAGFNIRESPRNIPLDIDDSGWLVDEGLVNRALDEPYRYTRRLDPVTGRPLTIRMPLGDFALRTTEFSHDETPGRRYYGGYFFIANGRVAVTPEQVKVLAFNMSEEYAYYCKVQFFAAGDASYGTQQFIEQAQDLLEGLLPELMRCLPDWSEVENGPDESSSVAATKQP